jgi:hypothetical protein
MRCIREASRSLPTGGRQPEKKQKGKTMKEEKTREIISLPSGTSSMSPVGGNGKGKVNKVLIIWGSL